MTVKPSVQVLRLYNDLPAHQLADGSVQIELGDLSAAEQRKLLLALAALGPARSPPSSASASVGTKKVASRSDGASPGADGDSVV